MKNDNQDWNSDFPIEEEVEDHASRTRRFLITCHEGPLGFTVRAEEQEALPMAKKYLSVSDWEAIDAAFLGHSDPMLGADARTEFDKLFTRIVNLAPPPIGLGPERQRA